MAGDNEAYVRRDEDSFRYEEQKKAHEAKPQAEEIQIKIKEKSSSASDDEDDYLTKVRKLTEFLEEGDKAK